jgi:hypothetical protein
MGNETIANIHGPSSSWRRRRKDRLSFEDNNGKPPQRSEQSSLESIFAFGLRTAVPEQSARSCEAGDGWVFAFLSTARSTTRRVAGLKLPRT